MDTVRYVSPEAICPFYRSEKGLKIRCEGFCASCLLEVLFKTPADMDSYKRKHCNSFIGCEECPIYPTINKQYQ